MKGFMRVVIGSRKTGLASLFRERNARWYFGGLALSVFGDSAMLLAAGVWVKELTGSSSAAGLVNFFVSAPSLISPVSGIVADRVKRRSLMIWTNLAMAAITLLLLPGAGQVSLIFGVMFAYGFSLTLLSAAQNGLLQAVVPSRLLGAANGIQTSLQESMKLIAPVAGAALLVRFGGSSVALFDAATFVVAAVTLSKLRINEANARPREGTWRTEALAGLQQIRSSPQLRQIVLACGTVLFFAGLSQTAMFSLVDQGLHRPPAFLGFLTSLQGLGSIALGVLAGQLLTKFGEMRLVGVGMLCYSTGTAALLTTWLPLVSASQVLRGFGLPMLIVGTYTLIQRTTPDYLIGRVASTATMALFVPQTFGLLAGAGLGTISSFHVAFVSIAIVSGACGMLLFRTFSSSVCLTHTQDTTSASSPVVDES